MSTGFVVGKVPGQVGGWTEFITDEEIYRRVVCEIVNASRKFLWIATSDLKDMYVSKGRKMVPFLEVLSDLVERGVEVRMVHAKEPGPNFRKDFDRYPGLFARMERVLCPRVHFKSVVVDGEVAYSGSANLTGAGMGAKGINRRNFESGFITTDPVFVNRIMEQFDELWMGKRCRECQRKGVCTDPITSEL